MLDAQIGRMLDRLREKGILDNTIIVFTSDHGYHLGWRGQWCKHSIDEQVLRVPLIVVHPQGMKGRHCKRNCRVAGPSPLFLRLRWIACSGNLWEKFSSLGPDPQQPVKMPPTVIGETAGQYVRIVGVLLNATMVPANSTIT